MQKKSSLNRHDNSTRKKSEMITLLMTFELVEWTLHPHHTSYDREEGRNNARNAGQETDQEYQVSWICEWKMYKLQHDIAWLRFIKCCFIFEIKKNEENSFRGYNLQWEWETTRNHSFPFKLNIYSDLTCRNIVVLNDVWCQPRH